MFEKEKSRLLFHTRKKCVEILMIRFWFLSAVTFTLDQNRKKRGKIVKFNLEFEEEERIKGKSYIQKWVKIEMKD